MKFTLKQNRIVDKILKVLFILLFYFSLYSCDKPTYCEESGKCDLLMRDWEINSIKIDGIDSLAIFMQHPYYCNTYRFDVLTETKYFIGNDCNSGSINQNTLGGNWELHSEENFSFEFYDSYFESFGPLFRGSINWTILELTDQDLKIRTTYKNKFYEIIFKGK
jgi:hypothetical protein